MKKSFLSFICVLVLAPNVWAGDYYFVGVDCFRKGFYEKASSNFEYAIKINPKNVSARYYLAQSYLKQNRISDAKAQYNRIILLAPSSDAATLSEKGLHLIKQAELGIAVKTASSVLATYQDNYLDYVLTSEGAIVKWASFPLTVYIEPGKAKNAAQKAFEQWQEKSGSLVSFNFVNSPSQAQITVDFKDKLESSSLDESYIAGVSKPYCQGENISKSEIHILNVDPDTKMPIADNFITFSTLHEIGHSLGFIGHSPDEKDIMSAVATDAKTQLTPRDLNTLNMFYKISKKELIARKSGQSNVKLQQVLDYVQKTPDKAIGWANLGDIYKSKKMFAEAIRNYQKAISIEPDKAELYNLLGSTYVDIGDNEKAFTNLKKACDLEKSNIFYLFQFAKTICNTKHKDVGKSYLNDYIQVNPQSRSDEKIQNLLKMYKEDAENF